MEEYSSLGNKVLDTSTEERLNEIRKNSTSIAGLITRHILNKRTLISEERLNRLAFGENKKSKPHKTILLVGETGAGKTTLINAIVNYMLGVKSEDRIWCEVIETKENQTNSQTQAVTVYDVFTEHSPFSLTVIDTPGFGSTYGIEEDFKIAESLHELFRTTNGVHEINAVCFVLTSVTIRLTDRQLYVFNAVLSLFSNDVEKNIVLIVTHSPRKPSNAIKAIKESKIPCAQTGKGEPVYFKFDSFHCEDFNDEEILQDYEHSWKLLNETMKDFSAFLKESKTVNLKMTEVVLRNRKQLISSMFNLKDKIRLTELKQKELKQTEQALMEHKETKGNFEFEVDKPYKIKVPIESKWWHFSKEATSCIVCEENCHYPGCWWVKDLSWCSVMTDGKCTVCTGRCDYTKHVKEGKIYEVKIKKVKKTKEDLKRKYESDGKQIKSLMSRLQNEIKEEGKAKTRLVEECCRCVFLLEEIALKSDSVYTLQHLDFLIEKVKETGNTDQVNKLEEVKNKADHKQFAQIAKWFNATVKDIKNKFV